MNTNRDLSYQLYLHKVEGFERTSYSKEHERYADVREGRIEQIKKNMAEVRVKESETLDSALRRFKRQCARSGVLAELRKREHYEKPSVKRKKKSEAARKRKYK